MLHHQWLWALAVMGCGLSHTGDAPLLDAAPDATSNCTLPLLGELEPSSPEMAATAFYIEPITGACRYDCPTCERPGWRHVLTFEQLPRSNRVTTSFTGVGSIDSVSQGTFVGDGLVRDIPWEVETVLGFKPDGGTVTFTLHESGSVTTSAFDL